MRGMIAYHSRGFNAAVEELQAADHLMASVPALHINMPHCFYSGLALLASCAIGSVASGVHIGVELEVIMHVDYSAESVDSKLALADRHVWRCMSQRRRGL